MTVELIRRLQREQAEEQRRLEKGATENKALEAEVWEIESQRRQQEIVVLRAKNKHLMDFSGALAALQEIDEKILKPEPTIKSTLWISDDFGHINLYWGKYFTIDGSGEADGVWVKTLFDKKDSYERVAGIKLSVNLSSETIFVEGKTGISVPYSNKQEIELRIANAYLHPYLKTYNNGNPDSSLPYYLTEHPFIF